VEGIGVLEGDSTGSSTFSGEGEEGGVFGRF